MKRLGYETMRPLLVILECLWGPLGASLTALGASWGALGSSSGALGDVLGAGNLYFLKTSFPPRREHDFQNHVPAYAKLLCFEKQKFLSRGRPQELPKSSQDPSKSPPRGPKRVPKSHPRAPKRVPKSSKRGLLYSKEDPKDAPRAPQEVS